MLRIWWAFFLICLAGIAHADLAGSIRVIDGDTFDIGNTRVRLHGIDAPEQHQTCIRDTATEFPCGAWVTREVSRRYEGAFAVCQPLSQDRWGRTVATCSVAGVDVGRWLVSEGLAFAARKYSMAYDLDEKRALVTGRGLHGMRTVAPARFRSDRGQAGQAATSTCAIKGNIAATGERIFHLPGDEHYDRTRITTRRGERWFCSAAEAVEAGWRRTRR